VSILTATYDEDVAKRVWQEEAREEGVEEGMLKGQINFAKKMIKRNRPIEEIAEDTGLTHDEILRLIAGY